jgi:hypothetical protein
MLPEVTISQIIEEGNNVKATICFTWDILGCTTIAVSSVTQARPEYRDRDDFNNRRYHIIFPVRTFPMYPHQRQARQITNLPIMNLPIQISSPESRLPDSFWITNSMSSLERHRSIQFWFNNAFTITPETRTVIDESVTLSNFGVIQRSIEQVTQNSLNMMHESSSLISPDQAASRPLSYLIDIEDRHNTRVDRIFGDHHITIEDASVLMDEISTYILSLIKKK